MSKEELKQKAARGLVSYISLMLKWAGGVMILVVVVMIALGSGDDDDTTSNEKWHDKDMSIDAYTYATMHLEKHMKSPRGTKHPWAGPRDCVTKTDSVTYVIDCYADAPNQFGTMIRVQYKAVVKIKENGDGDIIQFEIFE